MLFDEIYYVDMDEMEPAYYAGLLGKATTHLPAYVHYANNYTGDSYWYDEYYVWNLNSAGLPLSYKIKTVSSNNESDFNEGGVTFSW